MIPQVAEQGIAVFNDVFCEKGYFNLKQSERILKKGLDFGLQPRIHSDEFNNLGASKLGDRLNLISADHLMNIEKDDIDIMADSNTKAVLLPGTTFFLGHSNYAPYHKLKEAGIEVATATDYNPGSCNIQSMIFIITLATIFMKMDIIDNNKKLNFTTEEDLVGGVAYDSHGQPLSDKTLEKAKNCDAVLLGAVGGPKYDGLDFSLKPERGFLRLSKELDTLYLKPRVLGETLSILLIKT